MLVCVDLTVAPHKQVGTVCLRNGFGVRVLVLIRSRYIYSEEIEHAINLKILMIRGPPLVVGCILCNRGDRGYEEIVDYPGGHTAVLTHDAQLMWYVIMLLLHDSLAVGRGSDNEIRYVRLQEETDGAKEVGASAAA